MRGILKPQQLSLKCLFQIPSVSLIIDPCRSPKRSQNSFPALVWAHYSSLSSSSDLNPQSSKGLGGNQLDSINARIMFCPTTDVALKPWGECQSDHFIEEAAEPDELVTCWNGGSSTLHQHPTLLRWVRDKDPDTTSSTSANHLPWGVNKQPLFQDPPESSAPWRMSKQDLR